MAAATHSSELRAAGGGIMVTIMISVVEIEKAIESLPTSEMLEVAEWLDTQRVIISAAETTFQMLDDEEGQEAGRQWLG